jgi:AmmeMemoRadiSam system protein B
VEREWTHGPVSAGTFYPADPTVLRATVLRLLQEAEPPPCDGRVRGVVAPHAGYVYSGRVAASAYAVVDPEDFDEVVLVGPSHFERFAGLAALAASTWATPLGGVAVASPPETPPIVVRRTAYRGEHSLEVQLPFLQVIGAAGPVLPLLTGSVEPAVVTGLLDHLLGDRSLLVLSTDLSHYEPYDTARRIDRSTAEAVVALEAGGLGWETACGLTGLQAGVGLARRRGWEIRLLDLRNSGDTAGSAESVVGYGAFAMIEA